MKHLRILVMHGPNLNLLGTREPDHYGLQNLAAINDGIIATGDKLGCEIATFQSNHEGELLERIHQAAAEHMDGIVINPAAYTHTSIALRDAFLSCHIPFVELHLSNVHRREDFRHHSMLADIAVGIVAGFGPVSYQLALQGLIKHLHTNPADS